MHSTPVDEGVNVVEKECCKANCRRQVCDGRKTDRYPQHDTHDVVDGVCQGIIGASENGEHGRNETCRNGKGAHNQVVRFKVGKDKIERRGDDYCRNANPNTFFSGERCDFHFRFLFGKVAKPADTSGGSTRQRHAKVGDEFAVIALLQCHNGV